MQRSQCSAQGPSTAAAGARVGARGGLLCIGLKTVSLRQISRPWRAGRSPARGRSGSEGGGGWGGWAGKRAAHLVEPFRFVLAAEAPAPPACPAHLPGKTHALSGPRRGVQTHRLPHRKKSGKNHLDQVDHRGARGGCLQACRGLLGAVRACELHPSPDWLTFWLEDIVSDSQAKI